MKLELTIHNFKEKDGSTRYCYLLADGTQSPTLRLNPGDLLVLNLKNELSESNERRRRETTTDAVRSMHERRNVPHIDKSTLSRAHSAAGLPPRRRLEDIDSIG